MSLHSYNSALAEKAKQNRRNIHPIGCIKLGSLQYNAYVITPHNDINTDQIFQHLSEVKTRIIRSIHTSKWYDYFENDEGLMLIEWGNRGLTIFSYNICYYGPSLEIVAHNYYYRWSERVWKVETSTDPFVSIYGAGILAEFIKGIQDRYF